MTLDDIPLFAMLKNRLSYLQDRQQVIAQNVANSDTPGYTAMDLKPFQVPGSGGVQPVTPTLTSPMHLTPPATLSSGGDPVATPDSETTLNGNSVVLEEQMIKMSNARTEYDTAIGFYQQSLQLLQTAAQRPS